MSACLCKDASKPELGNDESNEGKKSTKRM